MRLTDALVFTSAGVESNESNLLLFSFARVRTLTLTASGLVCYINGKLNSELGWVPVGLIG